MTARAALLLIGLSACASSGASRTDPAAVATAVRMDTLPTVVMTFPREARSPAVIPFHPLSGREFPGPNRYRSPNGSPGPDYWQQRADYRVSATLDTASRSVRGAVQIRYTNNSPDTLRYVWLQLDQNLNRPGSQGSMLFAAESRWGVHGFKGGYELRDGRVNAQNVMSRVHDTRMQRSLPVPLKPKGGTTRCTMDFSCRLAEHGSERVGRGGALCESAQSYPRIAVYDDVTGWSTDPYLGQGEFYLEYGDIDFAITVPAGYTVAGSGTLQNPREVLTAVQRERLARAARTQEVVSIIPAAEARGRPTPGTRTWRFR